MKKKNQPIGVNFPRSRVTQTVADLGMKFFGLVLVVINAAQFALVHRTRNESPAQHFQLRNNRGRP